MKLKDFIELHAKEFDYDILVKRIDETGNIFYIDYANNYDAPYEKYFRDYFDWDVKYFKIENIVRRNLWLILKM